MAFDINSIKVFANAAKVHERRSEIIANNIANQDTPGFKAQDINFREALKSMHQYQKDPRSLQTNDVGHLNNKDKLDLEHLQYREALQPSLDGNTVDNQVEQAEFTENSVRYIANLEFMTGSFKSMMLAIKGGNR